MKRKPRARSKRHQEKRRGAAPTPRSRAEAPAVSAASVRQSEPKSEPVAKKQQDGSGLVTRVLLVTVAVVFAALIATFLSQRWQVAAGTWPTTRDVALSAAVGGCGTGMLVVACILAWVARRSAQSKSALLARLSLFVAILLAGLMLALRGHEYAELYADGLWRRSTSGPMHEHADIYYIQAVRQRLQELFDRLDDRRVNRPDQYTDEDQRRLDLVTNLQTNMVQWTQAQVGHWLEDVQQRRQLMEIVAFQVHPVGRNRTLVGDFVRQQRDEISRQRQWFILLRDYCQAKNDLLSASRKSRPAGALTSEGAKSPGEVSGETPVVEIAAKLDELDLGLRQKLESLGLDEWAFARSVIMDTTDLAMAGERLNQIVAQLAAMDSRGSFLDEVIAPVLEEPRSEGLNHKHRWLRLPVCLPNGNIWAGGYFALTSLHMLLVVVVAVISVLVLMHKSDAARLARWRTVEWWWYAACLTGAAIFLLFYVT